MIEFFFHISISQILYILQQFPSIYIIANIWRFSTYSVNKKLWYPDNDRSLCFLSFESTGTSNKSYNSSYISRIYFQDYYLCFFLLLSGRGTLCSASVGMTEKVSSRPSAGQKWLSILQHLSFPRVFSCFSFKTVPLYPIPFPMLVNKKGFQYFILKKEEEKNFENFIFFPVLKNAGNFNRRAFCKNQIGIKSLIYFVAFQDLAELELGGHMATGEESGSWRVNNGIQIWRAILKKSLCRVCDFRW